jgi:hypothetical protein
MRSLRPLLILGALFLGTGCNCGGRLNRVRVAVDVSPRALDFEVLAPGQLARRTLTFTAQGAQVQVDSFMLRDDVRRSFEVGTTPSVLQPGVPATVEVTYAPRSEGADSALLVASFEGLDDVTVPLIARSQGLFVNTDAGALNDAGLPVDAGVRVDAGLPVDAGVSVDAGIDAGVPSDAGAPNCFATLGDDAGATARDVTSSESGLPAIAWMGSGYVIAVDERVSTPNSEVSLQRTDEKGVLIAGPTFLSTIDGISSTWPSVSFSGQEYGVTWLDDRPATPTQTRKELHFVRADVNLQLIPGSERTLSTVGIAVKGAKVVFSPALNEWGVAWSDNMGVVFDRLSPTGSTVARLQLGFGDVSDSGNPLTATPTGWALIISGDDSRVVEIGNGPAVTTALLHKAFRASIAYGAGQLAVAYDVGFKPIQFMRVQSGYIVPNSLIEVGVRMNTGPIGPSLPSLGWDGTAFLLVWSDAYGGTPSPLSSVKIPPTMTSTSNVMGVPFTTRTNAQFNSVAVGTCGFAVVYRAPSTPSKPQTLEVHPY